MDNNKRVRAIRILSAAVAVVVVTSAVGLKAPGLALLAVPFAAGAIGLRRASWWGCALLLIAAAFFLYLGAASIASNGFDGDWPDLLFAYAGTPVAALLAVALVGQLASRRSHA